jgi:predicted nucleotidyltransferase
MTNTELLTTLKAALDSAFPSIVEKIILFGSHVDGTATDDSDWDILLVLAQEYDWRLKKNLRSTCYEVALNLNLVLDTKVIALHELDTARGSVMYIQDALQEGITV